MNLNEVIFDTNLPTIDLHGLDSSTARFKVLEFINDNKKMGNDIISIIHGRGSGILKNVVHDTLSKSRDVIDYKLFYNNTGETIAKIKTSIE